MWFRTLALTTILIVSMMPAQAGDLSPAANAAFLQANRAKAGVHVTASGLQYRVIKSGSGAVPRRNDTVVVRYRGSLIDGSVFDETKPADPPAELPAGRLIEGWMEALALMHVGDQWELVIPANIAYAGETKRDGTGKVVIPPNQTLVFTLDLQAIK